eukprot:TRINITY_DN10919_c0_g1_i1.p2 TRINITY_DN10919_c0_g1~~TRINITY_DN10919_c0_g1_i1.p2  ORF type:complete len:103 (-),score=15.81 TRINITY_DN10919_c0_g1_i1:175-483(-)
MVLGARRRRGAPARGAPLEREATVKVVVVVVVVVVMVVVGVVVVVVVVVVMVVGVGVVVVEGPRHGGVCSLPPLLARRKGGLRAAPVGISADDKRASAAAPA